MKIIDLQAKTKIIVVLFLFLLSTATTIHAQITIKGIVLSDADGSPMIGATVVEKGTSNGTLTDIDGNFSLAIASESSTIKISYLGYTSLEVASSGSFMTIKLREDLNKLDEIVVVGYGTQKKSDLISAVAKADLTKAVLTPTADVTEMLRGRISGLKVDVGGGSLRPGGSSELLFRGRGSVEGNVSGIYVVDGVVRDGGIEDINPDDIESMEFLKDASAQAIYGSRAVNGVVLITTKRGNSKDVKVNYHGFLSTRSIERNFDVYNGQEFAQLRREAYRSSTSSDMYIDDNIVFSALERESITNNDFVDWEEELLQKGMANSQSLNMSGGTDATKVYSSFNYYNEDGLIPTSSYSRKNLRLNVDQKITDKASVRFDLNLLNDNIERAANVNVITLSPLGRAYNEDGSLTRYPSGEELTATSPLWNLREQDHDEKGNDFVVNVLPSYQFSDNLKYQLRLSATRKNSERAQYQSSLSSAGNTDRGIARIDNQLREAFFVENILTYERPMRTADKLNLTVVQAMDENNFTRTFTEGRGFINESLGYNGITNAIGNVIVERDKTTIRTASYMGRVMYNLSEKYLFTATLRADGSSVNSADNKWTYNPAAAIAWKMHNEGFLSNVDAIQEMKLRLSYGSLANALSKPYTSLFTADGQNYIFDGQTASGYSPSSVLPNPNLDFETITTLNIGLDFTIFKKLLTGSIEYYDARTKNVLLRRGVPSTTGYNYTFFNAGELQNTGIELGLTANIINTANLQWSISTNWSNNKNKLLELYNDGDGNPILEDDAYNYYVGQPIGVIRQYEFDGIYQVGDDFEGSPQANIESTNPQENLRPGDIRIKDTNGVDADGNVTGVPDGKITPEDRVFTDGNPDWFGSLSTNMAFKGFDLFVDFYAVQGATKVNPFLSDFNNGGTLSGKLNGVKVPYYTPENPSNEFPRANFDSTPLYLNSLALKDASYVRLRTVSLGFTFPSTMISKIKVSNLRLYLTATNLFTNTDYIGYSPEVNIRNTFSSADTGYPDAKSYTIGLKVGL